MVHLLRCVLWEKRWAQQPLDRGHGCVTCCMCDRLCVRVTCMCDLLCVCVPTWDVNTGRALLWQAACGSSTNSSVGLLKHTHNLKQQFSLANQGSENCQSPFWAWTVWCCFVMLLYDAALWCCPVMLLCDAALWCCPVMLLCDAALWCCFMMLLCE